MPKTKQSTKEKFHKLEEIVAELENSDVDIDKALKLYKDGVDIVCDLSGRLKDVSKEINILKEKLDGAFSLDPFEGDEDDNGGC